jgi:hypothetical protein
MAKRMTSRFGGKCAECGVWMPAGTTILWDGAARRAVHAACPSPEEAAAARETRAAEIAARPMVPVAPALAEIAAARAAEEAKIAAAGCRAAYDAVEAALDAVGLCRTCNGTGTYEVRWSMDAGCVDYFTCDCNKEGRKATSRAALRAAHPAVEAACAAWERADAAVKAAERVIKALDEKADALAKVSRGVEVEVVRGRKVAKGTKGIVIWVGEGASFGGGFSGSRWGTRYPRPRPGAARIGVKDAAGEVHWTAATNVDVVARPAA